MNDPSPTPRSSPMGHSYSNASPREVRAKLTRCLETQRKIEAENARLRHQMKRIKEAFRIEPGKAFVLLPLSDIHEIARAALAAEGGET